MPILGVIASSMQTISAAFDSIQTYTLSSAQTTITFSSIPSTYKHLQIRGFWRGNRATYPVSGTNMTFNSDSGSNYSNHEIIGQGGGNLTSGVQVGGSASTTSIGVGQPGTSVTYFTTAIIDILDYANTNKYKTARCLMGNDINGTVAGYGGSVGLYSGSWRNTNAITSISFNVSDGSQWQQYSSFALYGIK
jgi:hypothetical protein